MSPQKKRAINHLSTAIQHYSTESTPHVIQDGPDALSHEKANKATSFGTMADQSLGDQIDKKQSHSQLPKPNLSAS